MKSYVKIKINKKATEQDIATALESNPRIHKILFSLHCEGIMEGRKQTLEQIKSKN